jgi:lysophosphatidylcholine acyltransferase / lyso-PAF acetyltransferase
MKNFRKLKTVVGWLFRAMIFFGSAHYVKIKGKRATSKEAPILLGTPHTSFFDALAVIISGPASVVGKVEAGKIPFYGSKYLNFF